MANITLKLNPSTAKDLSALFITDEPDEVSQIELRIRLHNTELNVREFGAFLSAIDGVYGRVSRISFVSYAHSAYRQIRISEVRNGSTELIIADTVSQIIQATPYVVLLLFIRYLGIGIKGLSEVAKNFGESYKSLHEGRLAKLNVKRMMDDMETDEVLKNLNSAQRRQLIRLIADLENAERKRVPAARRFAKKSLIDVKMLRKRIDRK